MAVLPELAVHAETAAAAHARASATAVSAPLLVGSDRESEQRQPDCASEQADCESEQQADRQSETETETAAALMATSQARGGQLWGLWARPFFGSVWPG